MPSRPSSLRLVPMRRKPLVVHDPRQALPVRSRWGGDLRLFAIAWLLGFVAFYAFIA